MKQFFTVDDELFDAMVQRTVEALDPAKIDAVLDKPMHNLIREIHEKMSNVTTAWSCSGHVSTDPDYDPKGPYKGQQFLILIANSKGADILESYLAEVKRLWDKGVFSDNHNPVSRCIRLVTLLKPTVADFEAKYAKKFYVEGDSTDMGRYYPAVRIDIGVRTDKQRTESIVLLEEALRNVIGE